MKKMSLSNVEKKKIRQERILESLIDLEFATRKQLQQIHNLGSDRNANRVLKDLGEWVNRGNLDGEYVYYLSEYGAKWLGIEKGVKWSSRVRHTIMRNDLYIYYGCPSDWENEKALEYTANVKIQGIYMKKNKTIVPDSRFTKERIRHYVEIDNLRQMKDNKLKLRDYAQMQESFELARGGYFNLIIYTSSPHRQKIFQGLMKKYKLRGQVFIKQDIEK